MEKYSVAMRAAVESGRADWIQLQRWVEKFICGTSEMQNIVGNRDHPDGGKITQAQFDAGERVAQVCPFVRDAIDQGLFYIEDSPLTELKEIRKLLARRIDDFINVAPAYSPLGEGRGAPMELGIKVLFIFFPKYEFTSAGPDHGVDQMYRLLIMTFIRQGLMLGQFYKGCAEPAKHNPSWTKVLTAPFLGFVIRYLQPHDKLFIVPGTPGYPYYQKLFPADAGHVHG